MRKIKKIICVVIILVQFFSIASGSAMEWTYEQIIGFIDAITIDGTKMFSDKEYATFNGPSSDNFFTMKGATLFWFSDTDHGELWLFNKDEKNLCCWKKAEKQYFSVIMPVLITTLSDYIDFNKSGKITFIITSEKNFTQPFIQLEYSKVQDKTGTIYTNPDKFCEDVKMIVNSTLLAETTELSPSPTSVPATTPKPIVTPKPTAKPTATSKPLTKIRINEGSNPNVRSKPSTDGHLLGNAKSGQVFDLLATSGTWYKIRLANGTEGWIANGMATVIGTTASSTQSNKATPKPTAKPTNKPTSKPTATPKPNSVYMSDKELIEMAKGYFYLHGGTEKGITGTSIEHQGNTSYVYIAYNFHCYVVKVNRKTGLGLGMTKLF